MTSSGPPSLAISRALLVLAALSVLVGLGVVLFLQPRYLGPCSVTTEFHCGYEARTGTKVGAGVAAVALALLLVWASRQIRKSPRMDEAGGEM